MMMRELREKTKIIMIVVALAFVGLMVFQWGMDISGSTVASQTGELGRVNGEPVSYEAYTTAYEQLYEQARAQTGANQLTREQIREIEDAAFDQVVNEILLAQEIRRRGLNASDQEILQAAQWMPHPDLVQNELFLTDGQFDINKYQQFLNSPSTNQQLLLQLESYYRTSIPRSKLLRQITAGLYLSDAELLQMWRDQQETVTVDYVPLNVAVLVPGDVEVTEGEIRDYYNDHREDFRRSETARFKIAWISKAATRADTIAALNRAQTVRQELLGGADFATVAARESADQGTREAGGELGTFARGQGMVAAFEDAAFSLPVGQISTPVQTEFGFHLIEVQERTGETVRARHILISYAPSDDALDELYSRADSLESLAERGGIDRAARALNGSVRDNVVVSLDQPFVPDVGSALEAIEWARDEQFEPDPLTISPVFETPEAFYIVETQQFSEAGDIPLEQATPEVRRQLIVAKKQEMAKQIGQQIVSEVRGGKPLAQAASERNLTVERTGPFTRMDFNPAFGQANAATGAAFGTPIGKVSDVVTTPGGLFIIAPVERAPADQQQFETQKETMRQFATLQLQQTVLARWLESLRREADIVDRREEMARAAARAPIVPLQ